MMEKYHFELDGRDIAVPFIAKLSLNLFREVATAEEVMHQYPHKIMGIIADKVVAEEDREFFGEHLTPETFGEFFKGWTAATPAAVNLTQ